MICLAPAKLIKAKCIWNELRSGAHHPPHGNTFMVQSAYSSGSIALQPVMVQEFLDVDVGRRWSICKQRNHFWLEGVPQRDVLLGRQSSAAVGDTVVVVGA